MEIKTCRWMETLRNRHSSRLTGWNTDRGQEGEKEPLAISSPVEQTPLNIYSVAMKTHILLVPVFWLLGFPVWKTLLHWMRVSVSSVTTGDVTFFFFLQSAAGVWMNVVICKKWWVVERWAFWPLGSELKLNCISKFKLLQLQLFGHVRISSCVIFFNPCIENNKALAKPEGVRCGLWATSAITQWRVRIILVGI